MQPFVENHGYLGTKGQSTRLEGNYRTWIREGKIFELSYMLHIAKICDSAWVKEGFYCGSKGFFLLALEGL